MNDGNLFGAEDPESLSMEELVEEKLSDDEKRAGSRDTAPGSPLYTAIHKIYGEIERLKESEWNDHNKYKFAPADAYRELMRKKFFEHKLIDRMSEVYCSSISDGLKSGTVKFQYEWWMIHVESGESTRPVMRSVLLPYVGSQTSGIASTFAWKEIVKNEFKISTGEPDPSHQMGDADDRVGDKLSVPESEEAAGHLSDALEALVKTKPTKEKLEAWKEEAHPVLSQLHNQYFLKLKAVYTKAYKAAE